MEIKSTRDIVPNRINVLIYGTSGAGKTTLAGTLTGKTLMVSLESGLLSLRNSDVHYIEIEGDKMTHLRKVMEFAKKSDYENIYIDSLTEVAQLFVDNAKKEYPEDRQTMKMWGRYAETITAFIKYCRDMNKNIFFTALEKSTQDEVGRRFSLPELQGAIASKCPAFFDFVFNLRVFKKEETEVRALLTRAKETFICKDRSGKLDEYEQPNLQSIIDKVFN